MTSKTDEAIARLTETTSKTVGQIDSAIAWIKGAAQMVRDAADDPDQINAIADQMDAKAAEIAQAIADNPPPA